MNVHDHDACLQTPNYRRYTASPGLGLDPAAGELVFTMFTWSSGPMTDGLKST